MIDEHGTVRAGNGTLEEAGQLGIEKVIVVETTGNELVAVKRTGLTEEQRKKYAIADNTASDFSTWDAEVLAEIAEEIDLDGFFPDDKLAEVLDGLGGKTNDSSSLEEDENSNPPETGSSETRVKPGDIWKLGRHYLLCGDSTNEQNIKHLLGDKLGNVGMVWADPPYGINIQHKDGNVGGGNKKGLGGTTMKAKCYPIIANDNNPELAATSFSFCNDIFPSAVHVWWGANNYPWVLPQSTAWIIWDKKTEKGDIEGIDFADAEIAYTNNKSAVRIFRHLWLGMWKQSEINEARVHPTQKPVALCEWFFNKYGGPKVYVSSPARQKYKGGS